MDTDSVIPSVRYRMVVDMDIGSLSLLVLGLIMVLHIMIHCAFSGRGDLHEMCLCFVVRYVLC